MRRRGRLFEKVLKVRRTGEGFVSKFSGVQRLIDYLWLRKSGSEQSVITFLDHVARFCLWAKMDPGEVLSKRREEIEGLVQGYLDEVRRRSMKRGPSVKHVNTALACLKTFFRVNGFNRENNSELRLQGYRQPPRTRNVAQCVPTIGEACRMAERARSKRNRAAIYTLFSTGLRNTALRAILVRDVIKEIEAGYENLLIKVEPQWNKRIPGACKNGIPYYTFTSCAATQAIKEMLQERKEKLGIVKEDEPLFISEGTKLKKRKAFSFRLLEEIVKTAAEEAGIEDWKNVRPHSLRKVFESVLRSLMVNGDRMDHKDQEFLMGHILPGPQDVYYDWSKIEKLRKEFTKLIFEDRENPELENLKTYREIARIFGIDADELRKKTEEQLSRQLTLKEEKEALETEIKSKLHLSNEKTEEQMVIPKEELQARLDDGWKFVSAVDEQRVVVGKPTTNTVSNFPSSSLTHEEKEKKDRKDAEEKS